LPIEREGQFYIARDGAYAPRLGLESSKLQACAIELSTRKYKGVFGSPCFGFNEQDLDILGDLPPLDSLWFWDINLKSVDGLYSQTNVKYLGIHPKRPRIDFSTFQMIHTLTWTPIKDDSGVSALKNLQKLHIWHYKPTSQSFTDIEMPNSLSELQLNWVNVTTLDALPCFPDLTHLEIHHSRNILTLDGLCQKFPRLEHLVITACGKLNVTAAIEAANGLKSIKHAYIQNRLVVPST